MKKSILTGVMVASLFVFALLTLLYDQRPAAAGDRECTWGAAKCCLFNPPCNHPECCPKPKED